MSRYRCTGDGDGRNASAAQGRLEPAGAEGAGKTGRCRPRAWRAGGHTLTSDIQAPGMRDNDSLLF